MIRNISLLLLLSFLSETGFCQNTSSKNSIYIVCRGTTLKRNLIGENFNILNKNITHIGIGYMENDSLKIYNVSNTQKQNNSSLIVEKWSEFSESSETFYLGIWELESDKKKIEEVKLLLQRYLSNRIEFDYQFSLNNESLYCSEFVAKILNESKLYKFRPTKKKLNSTLRSLTSARKLTYYPVDFFLRDKNFKQIYLKTITIK